MITDKTELLKQGFLTQSVFDTDKSVALVKHLICFAKEKGLIHNLGVKSFVKYAFDFCKKNKKLTDYCEKTVSVSVQISNFIKGNRKNLSEKIRTVIAFSLSQYYDEIINYKPSFDFDKQFYELKSFKERGKRIGTERIYESPNGLVIRKDNKTISLKIHVWQQNNMPEYDSELYCIDFKDGNIRNCNIENLFLTRKKFRISNGEKPTANVDNPRDHKTINIIRSKKPTRVVVLGTRYVPYEYFIVRYIFGYDVDTTVHSIVFKDLDNQNFSKDNLIVVKTKRKAEIIKTFS